MTQCAEKKNDVLQVDGRPEYLLSLDGQITPARRTATSALPPIADLRRQNWHVAKVPLPDSYTAANSNNVRCIRVPTEGLSTAPITDYSLSSDYAG
jgi:hypothetical protein